jgi:hypothetical protein
MIQIQRNVMTFLTVRISQNIFALVAAVAVALKRIFILNQLQSGVIKEH